MEKLIVKFNENKKLEIHAYLMRALENSPANKRKVASVLVNNVSDKIYYTTLSVNGVLDKFNINCVSINKSCESESNPNLTYNSVFHAEEQTILKAVKQGLPISDCTLFCTYSPCYKCCRTIIMSGCKNVIYFEKHPSDFESSEIKGDMSPKEFLAYYSVTATEYCPKMEEEAKFTEASNIFVIHHSNDIDGILSGVLLTKVVKNSWLPKPKIFGYNYQKTHEFMDEVTNNPDKKFILYFGDITPPLDWLKSISDRIASGNIQIFIYDHHQNAMNNIHLWYKNNSIDNLVIYDSQDNISAALLIFRLNIKKLTNTDMNVNLVQYIANMVSLYDTWEFTKCTLNDKLSVLYAHEFLYQFQTIENLSEYIDSCVNITQFQSEAKSFGSIIVNSKELASQKIFDESSVGNIDISDKIVHVIIVGNNYTDYYLNNVIEAELQLNSKLPKCWIGWDFCPKEQIVKFSVRASNRTPDASVLEVCQYYGGGGHPKAGGFAVSISEGLKIIERLLSSSDQKA